MCTYLFIYIYVCIYIYIYPSIRKIIFNKVGLGKAILPKCSGRPFRGMAVMAVPMHIHMALIVFFLSTFQISKPATFEAQPGSTFCLNLKLLMALGWNGKSANNISTSIGKTCELLTTSPICITGIPVPPFMIFVYLHGVEFAVAVCADAGSDWG